MYSAVRTMNKKIVVIGGGAAGLYAGAAAGLLCTAFPKKHRGLILERKPEPGKKLMITGSGTPASLAT